MECVCRRAATELVLFGLSGETAVATNRPRYATEFMSEKQVFRILYIAWLVAAGMLWFAVAGAHPYLFYTQLRWICCRVASIKKDTEEKNSFGRVREGGARV